MAASNIRFGEGVTKEVGFDLKNMGASNVLVFTDPNLARLEPMRVALDSLAKAKVPFQVYDRVLIEPTNESMEDAIAFARNNNFDAFLAVGGGSVMDTAKVANLYKVYPEAELLDFVNAPIGKALPVLRTLHPLICVTTTAGTGSETTGVAIFDHVPLQAKIGIGNRAIKPTLGLIDPLHLKHTPKMVTSFTGFDVLCHALESYTAIPFKSRPAPSDPKFRPAYQGSNPVSDIWSLHALQMCEKYFYRAVADPEDIEARGAMHLASGIAGIGFGNAGVHLCHGCSYPISGMIKGRGYTPEGYESCGKDLVPHGLSVTITAPEVFKFTAPGCPDRHLEGARALGADSRGIKQADAGLFLADTVKKYMYDLGCPDGLSAIGFDSSDVDQLVTVIIDNLYLSTGKIKGTLPQERVTKLAPRQFTPEDLGNIFSNSMKNY
ncbi:unnamed protein product [Oikopleura dioica]|uniref:Hydroxyacid-oxoacid transhydrogenase, mitochondrial n=1 Tax=Oikopleura dioica TaxID=34765 RepID=E4Y929_OIKDI|nr:unnamed protein product [Oikopleura dioica]